MTAPKLPAFLGALLCWASAGPSATAEAAAGALFSERAAELGLDFRHRHFGTGEKYMPENMGPGVALFDYDGDGRLDLYLVQGRPLPAGEATETNRLYRQTEAGRFEDVTARAGVGDAGYGMGAAFGDVDGDGDLDLYVTNFGPNVLYLNRGDGTFQKATARAGVECPGWSASAGFFDPDGDGDLDLYVANYLDFDFANHRWCGNAQAGIRSYCHPDAYAAVPDCFYSNRGDGTFEEASAAAGIVATADGQGLGLGFGDFDGSGSHDVLVANDAKMNHLYLSDGEGRFQESGLLSGVGFNRAGQPESSMGVAVDDLDGDGRAEIFLTHLDQQTNTLYRPTGVAVYRDETERAGLRSPSVPWVGFGTNALDPDGDGDLDLFVTNGHIIDNIELFDPSRSHRQPNQLFENRGDGTFEDASHRLGGPERVVGRGSAVGDLDGDGDPDLVVTQNDGPALVLVNGLDSHERFLSADLRARAGNESGLLAVVELTAGGARQARRIPSATSYLSQGPPEARFGLAGATRGDLVVHWPSGRIARYESLPAGRHYRIIEP